MSQGLGNTAIRTPDQRLRVFVSSAMRELAQERRAVERAILALRLTPVMFEQGARPHPPRDLYRAYLGQSDVFIGLYWQRYGWTGPGMLVSGVEEEFDLSRSMPRLLYVKEPAPDRESRLAELLNRIKDEALASYRTFRTPAELGRLVRDDLAMLLSERFAIPSEPAPTASAPRSRSPRPLPVTATSLVGRDQAIGELTELLCRRGTRLVTLTGPGGVGKTRLAVAAGERLRERFGGGVVFVQLADVADPETLLAAVGRAARADLAGTGSPLQALAERFGDDSWLLVLDNLDQVVEAAPDLNGVLASCPGVVILATSRRVLDLQAEREYPVPPLATPPGPAGTSVAEAAESPAVALFVERARAVRHGFTLTERNVAAVTGICRLVEGLPLAIELAAARIRLLDPSALLSRLAGSLDALGAGAADLPERQRTLRVTVNWSIDLLEDAERSLLETAAVFVDGWTVEAAAAVADLEEDQALELSETLARNSLIYLDSTAGPRARMLETVRAFAAERLAQRADAAAIRRRHAIYYRTLADRADRPLRGPGQQMWLDLIQAEAGNLASAVNWHLSHDAARLPHLFRALLPVWALHDDMSDARSWTEQLLPRSRSLDPQARAELFWTAAVTAREMADDEAALAAYHRLAAVLPTIQDAYLHAVSELSMAWITATTGDIDGGLREAEESLTQLRRQDEPFWTTAALVTVGSMETALGRYDDALRHLTEMRDRAERSGNARYIAAAKVQLGILAVMGGQTQEARVLLGEALDLSLEMSITRNVTLSLGAFAQLAFETGDPERAALLAGASEGLRRRAGLRAWPTVRRRDERPPLDELLREALGPDKFAGTIAAGTRLSQREAVAAARDQLPVTKAS